MKTTVFFVMGNGITLVLSELESNTLSDIIDKIRSTQKYSTIFEVLISKMVQYTLNKSTTLSCSYQIIIGKYKQFTGSSNIFKLRSLRQHMIKLGYDLWNFYLYCEQLAIMMIELNTIPLHEVKDIPEHGTHMEMLRCFAKGHKNKAMDLKNIIDDPNALFNKSFKNTLERREASQPATVVGSVMQGIFLSAAMSHNSLFGVCLLYTSRCV